MASFVTLRPNGTQFIDTYWRDHNNNNGGGGNAHGILADNWDGSWIYAVCCDNREADIHFNSWALAGNQKCSAMRLVQRIRGTSHPYNFRLDSWLRTNFGDVGGAQYNGPYNDPTPVWNAWALGDWPQSSIDGVRGVFYAYTGSGTTTPAVFEAYIDLEIRTQPVATITGPTGSSLPLRPTVTWSNNFQGDSAKAWQIHVRRNSDWALVYDTGVVQGSATSHTLNTDLAPGVAYTFHIRIATNFNGGDYWSNWSANSASVNRVPSATILSPTGLASTQPTVVWSYSDPEGNPQSYYRIKIFSAAQYNAGGFNPETSGSTWDSGDNASSATSRQISVVLNSGTLYRAYIKVADNFLNVYGTWSFSSFTATNQATATLSGFGDMSVAAEGLSTTANGTATLTGQGDMLGSAKQPLCIFSYVVPLYGGLYFCAENIGISEENDSNVRDLCYC